MHVCHWRLGMHCMALGMDERLATLLGWPAVLMPYQRVENPPHAAQVGAPGLPSLPCARVRETPQH